MRIFPIIKLKKKHDEIKKKLDSIVMVRNTADTTFSSTPPAVNNNINTALDNSKTSSKKSVQFNECINKSWHYEESKPINRKYARPGYLSSTIASHAKIVAESPFRLNTKRYSASPQTSTLKSSLKPGYIPPRQPVKPSSKNYLEPTLASLAKQITRVTNKNQRSGVPIQQSQGWEMSTVRDDSSTPEIKIMQFKDIAYTPYRLPIPTRS